MFLCVFCCVVGVLRGGYRWLDALLAMCYGNNDVWLHGCSLWLLGVNGRVSWLYIVGAMGFGGLWMQKSGICVPEACTEKVLRSQVRPQSTQPPSHLISSHLTPPCFPLPPLFRPGGQHGVDDVHRHAGRQRHAGHAPALRLRPLPHALLRPAPRGQGLLREPLSGNPALPSGSTWGGTRTSLFERAKAPSGLRGFRGFLSMVDT